MGTGWYPPWPTVSRAFALYLPGQVGARQAHAIHVLSITRAGVARVVDFHDPGLFPVFGLSTTIDKEDA